MQPFYAGCIFLYFLLKHMKTDDHREKFKQFSENNLIVVRGAIPDIDE